MRPSKLLFDEIVEKISKLYDKNEAKSITFLLFEQFTGFTKTDILSNKILIQNYDFEPLIKRLLNHEPVQYILGNTRFAGNEFIVKQGVTLIPRPETEELVALAISQLKLKKDNNQKLKVLDIGTGTGCIAISIAKELDYVDVTAWDISEKALEIAQFNNKLNKTTVIFELKNILEWPSINCQSFDLIISNPPYVTVSEMAKLNKNVIDFEPHLALFVPDNDPLIFYRNIAQFAKSKLVPNGLLLFEINENYGYETADILKKEGFEFCEIIADINNKNRIIIAKN